MPSQAGSFWPFSSVLSAPLCRLEKSADALSSGFDGDILQLRATASAQTVSLAFPAPILDYLFVEIDVVGPTLVNLFDQQIRLLGTALGAIAGPSVSLAVPVGPNSKRTYRFPYFGPLYGIEFSALAEATPLDVTAIRVFFNPPLLRTEIAPEIVDDSVNSASLLVSGFTRYADGIWSRDFAAAESVSGTILFTADGEDYSYGLVRISTQALPGDGELSFQYKDAPNTFFSVNAKSNSIYLWVDSQFQELPVTFENLGGNDELSVQVTLELFKKILPINAFGVPK